MIRAALLAAALVLPAAPALAQASVPMPAETTAPAPLPPAQQASDAAALALAQAYIPAETTVPEAGKQFETQFVASFATNPDNVALEKRYPGIRDAIAQAGKKKIAEVYVSELPGVHARIAAFLRLYLTTDDCLRVNEFLTSPLGRKMQGLVDVNIDTAALAEAAKDPETTPQLKRQDVGFDTRGLASLSPAELQQVHALNATPAFVHFNRISANLLGRVLAETNGMIERSMPGVKQSISSTAEAYIAAAQPGTRP